MSCAYFSEMWLCIWCIVTDLWAPQCTHLMYALLVVEVDQDEDGGADDATVPADKPGAHSQ